MTVEEDIKEIYEILDEYRKYTKKFNKVLDILINYLIRPDMNDKLCLLLFIVIQYKSWLERKNDIIYIIPSGRPHNISYFGAYNRKNIDIYYGKLRKRKLYQKNITLQSNYLAYNMESGKLTVHFKVKGENLCENMQGGVVVFKKGIKEATISNVKGGEIIIEGDSDEITFENISNAKITINSSIKKLVVKGIDANTKVYINNSINDFDFSNINGHIYINYQLPNDKLDKVDKAHVHVPQDLFMDYITTMHIVSVDIEKYAIKPLGRKKAIVEEPEKVSSKKISLRRLRNIFFGRFSKAELVKRAKEVGESLKNVFALHGVVINGKEFPIEVIKGSLEFFKKNKEWVKNKLHISDEGDWEYFSKFLVSYSKAWTGEEIKAEEVPDYFGYFLLGQTAIINGTIKSNDLGHKMSSGKLIIDSYENITDRGNLGFQMSGGKIFAKTIEARSVGFEMSGKGEIQAEKIKAKFVGSKMSGGKIKAKEIKAESVGFQMSGGRIEIDKLEKLFVSISVGGGTGGEIIINEEAPKDLKEVKEDNKTKIILKKNE